jgi:hypothetical protein
MDLVRRGRLSVQRVQLSAWDAIERLAEKGGWSEDVAKGKKRTRVEKERGGTRGGKRKKIDNEE